MKKACEGCKTEFQLQNFKLNHKQPHIFVTSQCERTAFLRKTFNLSTPQQYYLQLKLRKCIQLWTTSILPNMDLILDDISPYMELNISASSVRKGWKTSTTNVFYLPDKLGSYSSMPWYLKAVWVLHNVIGANSLLVTIGYYILLKPEYTPLSIAKHLINSVYIVMNAIVSAKPMRIYHIYQPMVFIVTYMIFSVIWHFSGGDPIYSVLDWSKVKTAAIVSVLWVLVGVPVMFLVLFGIHKLRNLIHSLCCTGDIDKSLSKTKDDFSEVKCEPK
ncbi:hypothetical protein KUTeg_021137 [Tegillarca granosa]|uniref:Protein rolling stone n=1 Tax=Tegillarca granosa TaxID=220873 RepID=A0ABQ9EAF0_TEGGR|nr:hypothetical protein KUTeg_021137 [Tegillarca granosa]